MKLLLLSIFFFSQNSYAFDHTHELWNKVITKNIHIKNKQSLIDYKKIKADPLNLNKYIDQLTILKKQEYETFNNKQKLSLMINAYNAYTIKLIVDNYPIKSIKDIGSLFSGPFEKDFFTFLGHKRNLDWIEHEVIRKKFKEPRIHFALVCASISCPNLQQKAFTESNLDTLLDQGATYFINNKNKNDLKDGTLYLSKIFKWYRLDFKGLHSFLKKYLKNKDFTDKTPIRWLNYNWDLNEMK